jgi:ATP-dependent Clp endopeptidase proteolytic subunit ClpP
MTKLDKDWVDAYFDHGVDVTNRRVFLDQDIEASTVSPVVKGLYLMETIDPETPIEMFVSSYGGCVYEALAVYDIMNTIKCPIHMFGYGKIMSAAVLLIAAGEPGHRWVAPHASFMHHDWAAWNHRAKKPADFYFTAEEALEWGVADSMWVEK